MKPHQNFEIWINAARTNMRKRNFDPFCRAMQQVNTLSAIEGYTIPADLAPYVVIKRL